MAWWFYRDLSHTESSAYILVLSLPQIQRCTDEAQQADTVNCLLWISKAKSVIFQEYSMLYNAYRYENECLRKSSTDEIYWF